MVMFSTGEPAPYSDMYNLAGHIQSNSSCQPDDEARKVPVVAGEGFPACKQCGNDAHWNV